MGSFHIGPLLISVSQAIMIAALIIAWGAGRLAAGGRRVAIGDALLSLALVGFVSARLVFVGHYLSSYGLHPLAWIDIRDGGFDWLGGVLGMVVYAAYLVWRRPLLRRSLSAALIAGALVWGLAHSALTFSDRSPSTLPAASLQTLDGRRTDLAELRRKAGGRPMVVNLWASWCPPCRAEMPVLEQAQTHESDVLFVFANQAESVSAIKDFLHSQQLHLKHVVRDSTGQLPEKVGSAGLPTTLFYDAQGHLVDTHMGPLSRATLTRSLERIEPDAPNPRPQHERTE